MLAMAGTLLRSIGQTPMRDWLIAITILLIAATLGFVSGYKYRHEMGVTYRYIYLSKQVTNK